MPLSGTSHVAKELGIGSSPLETTQGSHRKPGARRAASCLVMKQKVRLSVTRAPTSKQSRDRLSPHSTGRDTPPRAHRDVSGSVIAESFCSCKCCMMHVANCCGDARPLQYGRPVSPQRTKLMVKVTHR